MRDTKRRIKKFGVYGQGAKYGTEINSFSEEVEGEPLRKICTLGVSAKCKAVDFNHIDGCSKPIF